MALQLRPLKKVFGKRRIGGRDHQEDSRVLDPVQERPPARMNEVISGRKSKHRQQARSLNAEGGAAVVPE